MTNYTTEDFTDIRGPDEKPTVPGWYVTDHCDIGSEFIDFHNGVINRFNKTRYIFAMWTGSKWKNEYGGTLITNADVGRWFGLKEKP